MKILLIGPPASGKGTIGELLSAQLTIPLISIGQLLRNLPDNTALAKKMNAHMLRGELAPNDLAAQILKERVAQPDCANGYILDGWVRQLSDIDHFDPKPDKVLFLAISDDVAIKRISGRRICEADGKSYNIYTMTPQELTACDGKLTKRDDDSKEIVMARLAEYKELTVPAIEHYKAQGKLLEISADGTPTEIMQKVNSALQLPL